MNQAPSSPVTVEVDVPCIACGYNLRGLPTDGQCPECGTGIDGSIQQWRAKGKVPALDRADPHWLRRLAVGTLCMTVSGVMLVVVFTAFAPRAVGWQLATWLTADALGLASIFLITSREPGHAISGRMRGIYHILRRAAVWATLAPLVGALRWMTGWVGLDAFAYWLPLRLLIDASPYLGIVAGALYYAYAAGLLTRSASRHARVQAIALAILLPLFPILLFSLTYYASGKLDNSWVYFLRPATGLGFTHEPYVLLQRILLSPYTAGRPPSTMMQIRSWLPMASAIVPVWSIGFNAAATLLFWKASRISRVHREVGSNP